MDDQPFFRVVRGTPTAEELAALVGVLLQRARAVPAQEPPRPRSRWRESGLPAAPPRLGPGAVRTVDWGGSATYTAWRASALPR